MKITYSGHHLKITDDIHAYILKRANRMEARFGEMQELNVVLKAEKHQIDAEMILTANRASFYAESHAHELFTALDKVMGKINTQLRRYKDRVKDRRHRAPQREVVAQLNPSEAETDSEINTRETPAIVPVSEKFASKPLTVSEAAVELQTSGESLLLFLNADTKQVNLLYQTDENEYGWVEPLFV